MEGLRKSRELLPAALLSLVDENQQLDCFHWCLQDAHCGGGFLSESVPHCVGIPLGRYRPEGVRPPEATTRQPNATSRRFDRLSQATIDGIMRASPRLVLRQRSRRARVAVIGAERFLTEIETTSPNIPATWHMSERQRTGIAGLSTITCARTTPSKMPQRSHCRSPALSCRLQIRRPPK